MVDIFYLAFANRQNSPLPHLEEEAKKVYELLGEKSDKGINFLC